MSTLHIIARQQLIANQPLAGDRQVLLEGSWPAEHSCAEATSLDETLDSSDAWIDTLAAELGERVSALTEGHDVSVAYLNALPLRYYLVKLLRVVTYFRHHPLTAGQTVHLHVGPQDTDYFILLDQICRKSQAKLEVRRYNSASTSAAQLTNPWWRRLGAKVSQHSELEPTPHFPRVVLCGNRRLLDPVCAEWVKRRANTWWLYDRFSWKCWGRWAPRSVGQLVLNSDQPSCKTPDLAHAQHNSPLTHEQIDLWPAVADWLTAKQNSSGARQARIVERLHEEFARIEPTHLILDEDCTPLARAAVAVAQHYGATSAVLQNGAPGVRFGYVPIQADLVMAWGETSRQQFMEWGVAPQRIVVTGSPWHDGLIRRLAKTRNDVARRPRRVGVFLCPPARDERPDLVTYRKTSGTYRRMLENIFTVLAEQPDVQVWLRPHPRHTDSALLNDILQRHPELQVRRVADMPLAAVLENITCAISMASSSGVEAALAGVPVVQVLPERSGGILPAERWGMQGTARTADELRTLLSATPQQQRPVTPSSRIFANLTNPAAEAVVTQLLSATTPEMTVPFVKPPVADITTTRRAA